eukprot:266132_1
MQPFIYPKNVSIIQSEKHSNKKQHRKLVPIFYTTLTATFEFYFFLPLPGNNILLVHTTFFRHIFVDGLYAFFINNNIYPKYKWVQTSIFFIKIIFQCIFLLSFHCNRFHLVGDVSIS